MRPGDRVQVYTAWAAQGYGNPPLMQWVGGYDLVDIEGDTAILLHTRGFLAGYKVRHPLHHVRKDEST